MRNIKTIFRKEVSTYFNTPIGYIFSSFFLLLISFLFFYGLGGNSFWDLKIASLEQFFSWIPILYIIFIPAITMRIWSEEEKSGTIEVLMTLHPTRSPNSAYPRRLRFWSCFYGVYRDYPLGRSLYKHWINHFFSDARSNFCIHPYTTCLLSHVYHGISAYTQILWKFSRWIYRISFPLSTLRIFSNGSI